MCRRTLLALTLAAAGSPVLLSQDWMPLGSNAKVRASGQGVTLDYEVISGQLAMAVRPFAGGALVGMTRLQFRLKTDAATAVAVTLSEKKPGGGDYTAVFWSPQDQWQQIELTPTDFSANDGPKDPKDANGRLDLDQVQALAVLDLGQFFNAMPSTAEFPVAVDKISGAHRMEIGNFRVLTEKPETPAAGGVTIDDFRRGFLTWVTPGGAELSLSQTDNPLGKPALEASYTQDPGSFVILVRRFGSLDLRQARRLSFDIASANDAQIVLSLETDKAAGRPARYNITIEVDGRRRPDHREIPFQEFTRAGDSPQSAPERLDPARLRAITLVDVSAAVSGGTAENTLWLAEVKAQ